MVPGSVDAGRQLFPGASGERMQTSAGIYAPASLKNIRAILASGQDKAAQEQEKAAPSASRYGFTRGVEYYGRGNKGC